MLSVIVALGLSSCGGSQQPKKANLKTQEDSLNYAMGLVISEEILTNGLQNDSSEINAAFLVNKIEKFYKDKKVEIEKSLKELKVDEEDSVSIKEKLNSVYEDFKAKLKK